jgi:tetratricopeptide (TPR) repeat protein
MEQPRSESRRLADEGFPLPSPHALVFLLGVLTSLAYWNTLFYDFVWDDKWLVPDSTLIRQWSTLPRLLTSDFWAGEQPTSYYRPVVSLSYFLEYRLWGLNPAGYHLTNLLLHLSVTLLLFWLCQTLFRSVLLSFFAGLVFALHPIHTESVTFVSGRTDLFAALFFLLSLGLYHRARARDRWGGWRYTGALLAFALALLSKEVAAAFPLVLILYELLLREHRSEDRWSGVVLRHLPFWGVLAGYFLLRAIILGSPLSRSLQLDSAFPRILTGVKALATYLHLTVVPYPLNVQHMFFVPATWREPAFLASLALTLLALALTLLAAKRARFAGLWFFVTLLPASNLVPLSGTMMAERFLYLPSVGFSMLAAMGLTALLTSPRVLASSRGQRLAGLAICLLSLSYMGLTMLRNEDWRDEYRLFSRTVETSPLSALARVNLGYVHVRRGEYPLAIQQFQDALRLAPDTPRALVGLGVALSMVGSHGAAVAHGERALAREPESPVVHANLGTIYSNAGMLEKAITRYREALRKKPENVLSRYNLAVALASLGRSREALTELEIADRLAKLYLPDGRTALRFRALVLERSEPALAIPAWERYAAALSAIHHPTEFQVQEIQNARARLEQLRQNTPAKQG